MTHLFNSSTARVVEAHLQHPPHALLIAGPYGIGASSLAKKMATKLSSTVITVLPEKEESVDLDKGTITVALIRRLYEQTRTTIDSRVIIIDYAERMAPAAQNAFLKLLEEPAPGTSFILVTHEPAKLLPTVRSRVQRLDMLPLSHDQSQLLLDNLAVKDPVKRTQLLYMATGLPAELTRLANDQTYFDKGAETVRDAKQLLQGSAYEKLLLAQKYKDDRSGILKLIEVAMNILRQSLSQTPTVAAVSKIELLLEIYERISANGNIRLQLARAVL